MDSGVIKADEEGGVFCLFFVLIGATVWDVKKKVINVLPPPPSHPNVDAYTLLDLRVFCCVLLFFSVPSSVPTLEELFPYRSSQHSHPQPYPRSVLHHGPSARGPQEEVPDRW